MAGYFGQRSFFVIVYLPRRNTENALNATEGQRALEILCILGEVGHNCYWVNGKPLGERDYFLHLALTIFEIAPRGIILISWHCFLYLSFLFSFSVLCIVVILLIFSWTIPCVHYYVRLQPFMYNDHLLFIDVHV